MSSPALRTSPALRLVEGPAEGTPDLPVATESGSGVRRLPEGVLPDLTHLAEPLAPAEPPPIPPEARRRPRAVVERIDFDALCAGYGPRAPSFPADTYFPSVPGIPHLAILPRDDDVPTPALDGARVAVLVAGAVAGALLALL